MKLVNLRRRVGPWLGLVEDGAVLDVAAVPARRRAATPRLNALTSVEDAVAAGPAAHRALAALRRAVGPPSEGGPWRPLPRVRLAAPVRRPGKVVAIGLNYLDHCQEQGLPPPERPTVFAKFPTAVTGPGQPVRWDPRLSRKVDWEAELAVVIGRTARHVAAKDADRHVAGYMAANDVSARDLQFGDKQWTRGKSLDTFCPLGPWLATRDEVPDAGALGIRSRVNGATMQDASTSNMVFDVPHLIEFLSAAFTLAPGDVVLTGTPSGVGVFRDPPVFLKDGDVVEVEIDGLGTLRNPCRTAV